MEKFKIDLFEKEYDKKFPLIEALNIENCKHINQGILNKYSIKSKNVLSWLVENSSQYKDVSIYHNFCFTKLLDSLNISSHSTILINWYRFDNIDRIQLYDFDKYFEDIWFEGTDDIDVFDESLNWFISIRHDGEIYAFKR